jgi:mRNA-degrading endonuclease RelE of RelBE toxin-antitoxin system
MKKIELGEKIEVGWNYYLKWRVVGIRIIVTIIDKF